MIHPAHTFCFAELHTPDVARARRFYGELFGWTTVERAAMYSLFQKDGQTVAGLRRADGTESRWVSYVAVESVDRTAARVQELGGRVTLPGIETPGVARTAIVADREGVVLGLWEPREVGGADLQDRTGSMWWVELATADKAAARRFYVDLFGWRAEEVTKYGVEGGYTVFKAGDVSAGGAFQFEPDWGVAPAWQVFFAIDDYDGVLKRAETLGAEPGFQREVPNAGHLCVISDPSDALFLVMRPNVPAV